MDENKGKTKMNLSDEEREKRRQRMLLLREKLNKIKDYKQSEIKEDIKKIKEQNKAVKINKELENRANKSNTKPNVKECEVVSSDEEDEVKPIKKINNVKPKKMVVKKVSIKYYGNNVSREEIENDNMLLQQLHRSDYEHETKNKKTKANKQVEDVKPIDEVEEVKPNKVEHVKPSKVDLAMKELFGI